MEGSQQTVSADGGLSKSREADWPTVLFFIHIHLLSLYGLWLLLYEVKWMTIVFLVVLIWVALMGVTTGAHRLWAHRTYETTTSHKIVLMLSQTLAGQGSIYEWVKSHRMHHAHFATELDPYNYNKGFLYAHILTRLRKKSELQEHLMNSVDMSDLEKDSVVMFQKRFYWLLYGILFLLLPLNAPLEYWNDSVLSAVFVIGFLRYLVVLHGAWLVESGICVWGLKPGEKYPADSNLVFLINKTFWPHYHYLLPRDYKSGEYGTYDSGCFTALIKVRAAIGAAHNLCTVDTKTIQQALAEAAKTSKPLAECLDKAIVEQNKPDDQFISSRA